VPVTGVVGGALSFNGTGQYVQSPDSIATNFGPATSSPCVSSGDYSSCPGDFSIDTWIMTSSDGVILDKRVSTPIGYAFYLQNGMLGLQLADGLGSVGYSNYFSPNVSTILYNGQWHHVVVTVQRTSPSVITWYLDGYCVGFPACTTSIPSDRLGSLVNASPLFIATNSTYIPPVGFLSGALDELEIYNRVLTPTEVLGIFNALSYGKCKP